MAAIAGLIGALVIFGIVAVYATVRARKAVAATQLADALAEARRWYERLGGQVLSLSANGSPAAQQALSDASERYNAAGGQLEQARTAAQAGFARQTALEGLHYVGAARSALGLDPGPPLPVTQEERAAGAVTEDREVTVEGRQYATGPQPTARTTHYYPGGMVAGRPVPRGWYSEPFWKTALVGGAWGLGTGLLFGSLFGGMAGLGWAGSEFGGGWGDNDGGGNDGDGDGGGGDNGDYADGGGDYDGGGSDGGGDFGGDSLADGGWGGGDFGGGDFGGGDFGGGDF
ncbi:MAG: hypothetical protein QOD41_4456 [Cryptosporangiaceae bacterium]|jgi:uncharacterized membrane protein YgcG|nr:hypothetical protein [Cryptosporangiaceae bacterium]